MIELKYNVLKAFNTLYLPVIYHEMTIDPPELLFCLRKENVIGVGLNTGTHPCCYVTETNGKLETIPLHQGGVSSYTKCSPHGGFTYSGAGILPFMGGKEVIWWGWDYAHLGDYSGYMRGMKDIFLNENKRWTTPELMKHTQEIINHFHNEFK